MQEVRPIRVLVMDDHTVQRQGLFAANAQLCHRGGRRRRKRASLVRRRKIAGINAVVFFFLWLVVLLAGADKPPPIGFLWLVPVIALSAVVVYWRIPTYILWFQTQQPGRLLRVAIEGFVAGLVVAMPFALSGSGEPSVTMQPIAYVVWFSVLGLMGMLNSLTLYGINAVLAKGFDSE